MLVILIYIIHSLIQLNCFKYCCVIIIIIQSNSHLFANNGFKYRKWLNISIWTIDRTWTGANTLGQCKPENNGNEGLVGFYGISTFVGYLMPNPFLYK